MQVTAGDCLKQLRMLTATDVRRSPLQCCNCSFSQQNILLNLNVKWRAYVCCSFLFQPRGVSPPRPIRWTRLSKWYRKVPRVFSYGALRYFTWSEPHFIVACCHCWLAVKLQCKRMSSFRTSSPWFSLYIFCTLPRALAIDRLYKQWTFSNQDWVLNYVMAFVVKFDLLISLSLWKTQVYCANGKLPLRMIIQ